MTQNRNAGKRLGPAGNAIVARLNGALTAANLRNAAQICEHVERSVNFAHALAGAKFGLCNIDGDLFHVRFDLDDDPEPNGLCTARGDHFELRLTLGLLHQQLELCGFVAARLTAMDLVTPALSSSAGAELLLTRTEPSQLGFSAIIRTAWPDSRERSQFGGDLFETVLQFVWGHELAHAQFAHADFVRQLGLTTLYERSRGLKSSHAETFRALEAQADWYAASYLCETILAIEDDSIAGRLALIPMAGALLGLTWHVLEGSVEDQSRSHPSPRERARLAFVAVAATLAERGRRDLVIPLADRTSEVYASLERFGEPFDMLSGVGIESALTDFSGARRKIHAMLHHLSPGLYERRYRFAGQQT